MVIVQYFLRRKTLHILWHVLLSIKQYYICTSRFWPRMRARALCPPAFWGSLPCQTGRCAPPAHAASMLLIYLPKNFPEARTRATKGLFLPIGLSCTLPYSAKLHTFELRCSVSELSWALRATLHFLSQAAPFWAVFVRISDMARISASFGLFYVLWCYLLTYTHTHTHTRTHTHTDKVP